MEHANSNPKGWVVRADCESVLPITVANSQSSAWRKSKRVLRVSVRPESSRVDREEVGDWKWQLRWNRVRASLGIGNSTTKVSRSPGVTNHLAWVKCGDHAGGSPIDLNSVAWVTTDKRRRPTVMCGERKFIVQSRWPARLAVLSRRKLWDKRASLATVETLGSASFSDGLRPYLKPERVRDNKERQLGGRPAEFRQQASSFGHSQGEHRKMEPGVKLPATEGGTTGDQFTGLHESSRFWQQNRLAR